MHPNNKLTINAVEAAPLDDFSPEVYSYAVLCHEFKFTICDHFSEYFRLFDRILRRPRKLRREMGQRRTSLRHK